jgi:predicted nucleotidyltransferase
MLTTLFSSRVRTKILTTLFLTPGNPRNAWELAHSLDENYSAVWKELNRLEESGILKSEPRGNAKSYRVDPACPIESELRSMILKTEGIGGVLREKFGALGNVKKAFIYGSFASGEADERSDIDLMVIGEINLEELADLIAEAEKELNRPINYVIYSEKEWGDKLANQDPFAENVDHSKKIMLIGGENAI